MIGKIWKMGLQNCVVGCMIMVLMIMTGCSSSQMPKVQDEESAMAMLEGLACYEAQVEITFFSNKGENTYRVSQRARATGEYRLEILEPENFAGVLTICDGSRVMQTDPTIGGQVEAKQTPVRDALMLYAFIEAYQQNPAGCTEGADDTLVLSAVYPGEHRKIVSAQLTLAKGSGVPLSLEVFDDEGKTSLHMTYLTFQMNPEWEEENFQIAG